jgi:hypothetical protein
MDDEQQQDGYGKRPLWHWIVLYIVVGVVVYSVVYYFVLAKHQSNYGMSSSPTVTPTMTAKPTAAMQKFSDSGDYQYAYKIFPGNISTESKQAMSGFAMTTKVMPDGSTQIVLTAQKQGYTSQQYVVKPGYSLYFIERNLKDDNPQTDSDATLHDDTAILVDPQGNISQ